MRSSAVRWLAGAAMAISLGIPWAALQTIAWAGMFLRFAQEDPVTTAWVKTFDGQHPCTLCLALRQARSESAERTEPPLKPVLDLVIHAAPFHLGFPSPIPAPRLPPGTFGPTRGDPPPRPRPRQTPRTPA